MSDAGSILDKLLLHAVAADANYSTTRGVGLHTSLNDEEFPHVYAYEPKMAIDLRPFLQEGASGDYTIMIVTKAETQEELLVRTDAFRARIQGDRTLAGEVRTAYVSAIEVFEDPRDGHKAAKIIVSTEKVE